MSELLDELARALAGSIPRSRALRLMGGAVLAVAVPGTARTTKARAASRFHTCKRDGGILCECNCAGDVCQRICCTPKEDYDCKCGTVAEGAMCVRKCAAKCGGKCCQKGEFCANLSLELCCKDGERGCGPVCCQPNEECRTGRVGGGSVRVCTKRCPLGQAWCGKDKCCPPKWHCKDEARGLCKRCKTSEEECGTKCCDKRTSRCCGKAGCCPKGRACCNTGKTQRCCSAGQKCAIPILAGDIGIKPGTASICCPSARYNKSPALCCPPGQVALNTPGFRTPPPGISPYCCPPAQVCVSGAARICANLQSDAQNCGRCGNVCESGICNGGICALP